MKRILLGFLALGFIGFVSQPASAGFLIDPYVGAEQGSTDDGTTEDDFDMTTFGARLGWTGLGLFGLGIDYMKGSGSTDATPSADLDATDIGLFVMVEFPILLRIYATYFATSDLTATVGSTDVEYSGTATKIGLSYTGLPFVAIDAAMITRTYDEGESGGVALTNVDFDATSTMLSISVPLP